MQLYINNLKADLYSGEETPKFTYQKTDYSDPTAVTNSFSTSISLPVSERNTAIFESFGRLDRVNANFNASFRSPFILYNDSNETLESGYCKLDSVTRDAFKITLFGGVGGWLYSLMYRDDGEKMTLADLGLGLDFVINKSTVNTAWETLRNRKPTSSSKWLLLNFTPTNGYPSGMDNFDPAYVCMQYASYSKVHFCEGNYSAPDTPSNRLLAPDLPVPNANYYELPSGWGAIVRDGGSDDLTPFDTFDFRSYLMRPILNVKILVEKIVEKTGYTLSVSDSLLYDKRWKDGWITLPPLYKLKPDIKTGSQITDDILFEGSSAPAEYIISLIKLFGCFLDIDSINKVIYIRLRKDYFTGDIQTIQVKDDELEMNTLNFENKYFDLKWKEGDAAVIKDYKDQYEKDYGRQRVDTGYQFTVDAKDFFDNFILSNAVDATGQSQYYHQAISDETTGVYTYPSVLGDNRYWSKLRYARRGVDDDVFDTFEVILNTTTDVDGEKNISFKRSRDGRLWSSPWSGGKIGGQILDCIPKPSLTDSSGNELDARNVLLVYNGFVNPSIKRMISLTTVKEHPYILSDDLPRDVVNRLFEDGKQCYIDTNGQTYGDVALNLEYGYPHFARCEYSYATTYKQLNLLDFGAPAEIYSYYTTLDDRNTIYNDYWKNYVGDIYNVNTTTISLEVMRSTFVGDVNNWFREFYHLSKDGAGSLWSLQKVDNLDLEGDTVKCTFIRVMNKENYLG